MWSVVFFLGLIKALAYAAASKYEKIVPLVNISAVEGGAVELPCDITPSGPDSLHMVLWFKDDTNGKPLYTVDVRGKALTEAEHTSDGLVFGTRAYFRTGLSSPAVLVLDDIKRHDAAIYRCRVDFGQGQTRNVHYNLSVIGSGSKSKSGEHSEDRRESLSSGKKRRSSTSNNANDGEETAAAEAAKLHEQQELLQKQHKIVMKNLMTKQAQDLLQLQARVDLEHRHNCAQRTEKYAQDISALGLLNGDQESPPTNTVPSGEVQFNDLTEYWQNELTQMRTAIYRRDDTIKRQETIIREQREKIKQLEAEKRVDEDPGRTANCMKAEVQRVEHPKAKTGNTKTETDPLPKNDESKRRPNWYTKRQQKKQFQGNAKNTLSTTRPQAKQWNNKGLGNEVKNAVKALFEENQSKGMPSLVPPVVMPQYVMPQLGPPMPLQYAPSGPAYPYQHATAPAWRPGYY